ncbi:penicillin-binding transpeptidase domain-containing protein [Clostridium sp. AM58-1XD]|uniref:penicillin-binding transpeptidase domain-containing protein n=1 Tax=Clostridium sp. AM58-1XD TaxID=2292307 RepID=UPI00241DEBB1|nr:penicillin-binding transpeptidase domain-containing protein [Clostridium sp. AM58-1XD]
MSPVEQAELLQKLRNNEFGFHPANIQAVKESILLSSSENGSFYGKTGTGQINGKNVNGWFVGYVEKPDRVYYFAANIHGRSGAVGSKAAEITQSVLSDMQIWD